MQRAVVAFFAIAAAGCLTTVDQRWCDRSRPCTPGFVCTPDFHCVLAPRSDAGTGGGASGGGAGGGAFGGGAGGGALGGGAGGGGAGGGAFGGGAGGGGRTGGGAGGGGGVTCNSNTCPRGCCAAGRCVDFAGQTDFQCGLGGLTCSPCLVSQRCTTGTCVSTPDAGPPGVVGSACTRDEDCGSDGISFCIPATSGGAPTGFEGGYCSRLCDVAPCPGTARCLPADDGAGGEVNICVASCMTTAQCRPQYFCDTAFGSGVCLP